MSDSHLVQPDGVLTVVDPAAVGEEELGEWDLRGRSGSMRNGESTKSAISWQVC